MRMHMRNNRANAQCYLFTQQLPFTLPRFQWLGRESCTHLPQGWFTHPAEWSVREYVTLDLQGSPCVWPSLQDVNPSRSAQTTHKRISQRTLVHACSAQGCFGAERSKEGFATHAGQSPGRIPLAASRMLSILYCNIVISSGGTSS